MEFSIEEITPTMARQYLESRGVNRRLSQANINKYAATMMQGQWQLNGESAKFDQWGVLIDGQHRMEAIVKAGVPVKMAVVRGINGTTFETFDLGKSRSFPDVLSIYGYRDPLTLSSITRSLYLTKHYGNPTGENVGSKVPVAELLGYLKTHPYQDILLEAVTKSREISVKGSFFSPKISGFLWAVTALIGGQAFTDFWIDFADSDLSEDHPIQALRRRIKTDLLAKSNMSAKEGFALTIKAYNAVAENRPVANLVFRMFGDKAEAFPSITGLRAGVL